MTVYDDVNKRAVGYCIAGGKQIVITIARDLYADEYGIDAAEATRTEALFKASEAEDAAAWKCREISI